MMGAALYVLSLAIAAPPQSAASIVSRDRSFNVTGFYCNDKVCDDPPRPIGEVLVFDRSAVQKSFAGAVHRKNNWSVWLNCSVTDKRLKGCRADTADIEASVEWSIALRLVRRVSLETNGTFAPRAMVLVQYETGDCPSWDCIIHPFPAPPPPSN